MRKISTTLAVMSLLAPVGASALGIGEIKLRSSLNQTFKAEIPLVTSGSESLDDIKVNIASAEAFGKAGIDRHFFLTKLRFTPTQKPDGSYVVQISSQEVVREPFLNFLVEVNWPNGRVLREFTVLLDPPSTFKEESVTSSNLPTFSSTARHELQPISKPPIARASKTSTAAPRPEVRLSGSEYGPVKRDETLGTIARQISREMGVGQQQMLTALYQANPTAFYRDSVNALKAGETLKIPDKEYILSISPKAAKTQLSEQAPPREGKLTERAETSERGPEVAPQGQLKLLAPDEDKSKLGAAVPGAREESGKTKSDIALEVADTVRQENEDIRSRLQGLEKQLADMQRLLQIKDDQLAQMKSQGKPPEQAQLPIETPPLASPLAATAPQLAPSVQETSIPPAPVTAIKEAAEQPAAKLGEPAPVAEAPVPSTPAPKIAAVTPKPAPVAPAVPEVEEPSLLAELLENPALPLAGAAGAVLLGLLAWLTVRRRTAIDEASSESILAPSIQERTAVSAAVAANAGAESATQTNVPVAAKSSFLSEFTPSDFDALGDTDEVDPISEADVYLAYGRYKQAEELIRGAIDQYPERDECKLKLLEIHYATENRQAFEEYAKELFEQNKDNNPEFWDKVVEMGCELCPNSSLFKTVHSFSSNSSEHVYPTDELGDSSAINLDLDADFIADLKQFEKNKKTGQAPKYTAPSPLDFDSEAIQDFNENAAAIPDIDETQPSELASLEFDLTALNLPSAAEQQEKANDLELDLDNLIAFDSAGSKKKASSNKPSVEQTKPDKTLDDILIEMGAKPAPTSETEQAAIPMPSASLTSTDADDELYASLTDMDEQETKLDLAKAYIDMGDARTAKEIAEDVLQKGTDVQKKEAQALLEKVEKLA